MMKKGEKMVVTDLIHKVVGRSDYSSSDKDKGVISLCYSGDEDKRETERSILQQSGVKLSEVKVLEKEGVVRRIWLDDYCCGLELDLERTWLLSEYSREYLEIWI
jgi:hypothetical protein